MTLNKPMFKVFENLQKFYPTNGRAEIPSDRQTKRDVCGL